MEYVDTFEEARAAQDALEAEMFGHRPIRTTTPLPRVEVKAVAVGGGHTPLPRSTRPIVAVRVDEPVEETPAIPVPRIPLRPVSRPTPTPVAPSTWQEEVEASAIPVDDYIPTHVALPVTPPSVVEVEEDREEEDREEQAQVSPASAPATVTRKRKPRPARRTITGTERDRTILNRLVLVGMSTTSIMVDLVSDGSSVKAIEKRLYEMQAAGLTRRIPGVWNCPSVWVPTRRGIGLSRYPEAPLRSASDLPWTVATHELKIAEVVAALRTGRLARHFTIPARSLVMTGRLIEAAFNRKGALLLDASATDTDYMESPESLALLTTDPGKGYRPKFADIVILRPGMHPIYIEVERSKKRDYEYEDIMGTFYAPTGAEVVYLVQAPTIGSAVTRAAREAGIEIIVGIADGNANGNAIGTTLRVADMDLSWLV